MIGGGYQITVGGQEIRLPEAKDFSFVAPSSAVDLMAAIKASLAAGGGK